MCESLEHSCCRERCLRRPTVRAFEAASAVDKWKLIRGPVGDRQKLRQELTSCFRDYQITRICQVFVALPLTLWQKLCNMKRRCCALVLNAGCTKWSPCVDVESIGGAAASRSSVQNIFPYCKPIGCRTGVQASRQTTRGNGLWAYRSLS